MGDLFTGIIVIIGILWFIGFISEMFSSSDSVEQASDSYSGNEIEPFQVKLAKGTLDDDDPSSLPTKKVRVRGLFPVSKRIDGRLIISLFDMTDEDAPAPVISHLDQLQESDSAAFQMFADIGMISPDEAFIKWVTIAEIIPDLLQPQYSGKKKITVITRLVDKNDPPTISLGFADDSDRIFWTGENSFKYKFEEAGYIEASDNRDEAHALTIKIAVALAWADGSFDDTEGMVIKEWITKTLSIYSDDERDALKSQYNEAMREAFKEASAGNLALGPITERLNEIGEKSIKYDTLELAVAVMAADGNIDADEMRAVNNVADALGIDYEELEKMKDQVIVDINPAESGQSLENALGINEDWDKSKVKKHLRTEFQKWNNRLTALPEGDERENAQNMLNLIAEARSRYS